MSRVDGDQLEERLAERAASSLPPALRGRVLAGIDRALGRAEPRPHIFMTQVLPIAAALLVCANLLLFLLPKSNHGTLEHSAVVQSPESFGRAATLPPGVTEYEVQRLSFLLHANAGSTRSPALSTPLLRRLLHEESSSWITP
jgi:hypothetical protein